MARTQNDKVLNHCKMYGGITSYEAFAKYNITRLAARISDLERKGYHFRHCPITRTVNGETKRYTKYELIEEE